MKIAAFLGHLVLMFFYALGAGAYFTYQCLLEGWDIAVAGLQADDE